MMLLSDSSLESCGLRGSVYTIVHLSLCMRLHVLHAYRMRSGLTESYVRKSCIVP